MIGSYMTKTVCHLLHFLKSNIPQSSLDDAFTGNREAFGEEHQYLSSLGAVLSVPVVAVDDDVD